MNKIWVGIMMFCLLYGVATRRTAAMTQAALDVPYRTFDLIIKIGGVIVFYNGLFQMAIDAGLIDRFSQLLKKPMRRLFPRLAPNSAAHRYICANLAANLLGLGAGATPLALKALKEMKKENDNKEEATSSMTMLVLLNITSFTLFPLTIIGIREIYQAEITIGLIPYIIIATFILTVFAVIICRLTAGKNEK